MRPLRRARLGRRARAEVETSAPRRMEQCAVASPTAAFAAGMDESEQPPRGDAGRVTAAPLTSSPSIGSSLMTALPIRSRPKGNAPTAPPTAPLSNRPPVTDVREVTGHDMCAACGWRGSRWFREQRPSAAGARCMPAEGRQAAMQMAMTTRRRSIGLAASVPYTSHPFALSVPPAGGVGRLPATTP